ncbi:MAG: peptidoglycan DD-metalloendopeptidase family protein [Saccharospirillaceae bacterium]|nr:peptidoglycan DD-metalloendopeptidase family protein [Pseudomonadales bacterium]NRB79370.1 peptidoglycan DD-metalloendopeptidase family protein [Saccharospirillaceae bacterium]
MQKLFFILILMCSTFTVQLHAKSEKQLKQAELEQLNGKINKLKSDLKKQQNKHNKQTNELATIESSIGKNEKNILSIKNKLLQLDKSKKKLLLKKQDLINDQSALKNQMEVLFLDLYRQGQQAWLKTLLSETNPANFSRKLKYVEFITLSQRDALQSFFDNQLLLEKTISDIDEKTQSSEQQQLSLSKTQQSLLANQQLRKKEVSKLNKTITSSKQKIDIHTKNKKQLEQLIQKMLLSLSNQDLGLEDIQFSQLKGKLRWPIKSRASNRFGTKTPTGRQWDGWEMPTTAGTTVNVIASGRVIFSDWLRGFGLLIIIDHGDGYLSLYGRNQSLLKEEGQWVSANEPISMVGVSGGFEKTALYFEIRKNSKPQDPAFWLSKTIK